MSNRSKDFPDDDEQPRSHGTFVSNSQPGFIRDPAAPNPYRLPDPPMHPMQVPNQGDVERRGGTYQKAKHTATLPNALMQAWPPHLLDELYAFCWANHHGTGNVLALVSRLADREIAHLIDAVSEFESSGGKFHHVGTAIYEALWAEARRRDAVHTRRQNLPRVRVDVRPVEDDAREPIMLPASTPERNRLS
jgi:hypothetical protein